MQYIYSVIIIVVEITVPTCTQKLIEAKLAIIEVILRLKVCNQLFQ